MWYCAGRKAAVAGGYDSIRGCIHGLCPSLKCDVFLTGGIGFPTVDDE
jgi:hypothetical protein